MLDNTLPTYPFVPPSHDTPYTQQEIQYWFTHGTLPEIKGVIIKNIHDLARQLALLINSTLPSNVETNTALDRLQESVMWANTSISR